MHGYIFSSFQQKKKKLFRQLVVFRRILKNSANGRIQGKAKTKYYIEQRTLNKVRWFSLVVLNYIIVVKDFCSGRYYCSEIQRQVKKNMWQNFIINKNETFSSFFFTYRRKSQNNTFELITLFVLNENYIAKSDENNYFIQFMISFMRLNFAHTHTFLWHVRIIMSHHEEWRMTREWH